MGFTGAELENLVNQAALKAAVDLRERVTMRELEFAKDKILMGEDVGAQTQGRTHRGTRTNAYAGAPTRTPCLQTHGHAYEDAHTYAHIYAGAHAHPHMQAQTHAPTHMQEHTHTPRGRRMHKHPRWGP